MGTRAEGGWVSRRHRKRRKKKKTRVWKSEKKLEKKLEKNSFFLLTLTSLSHPADTMIGLAGAGENRTQETHSV